jgi:AAA domain-containing protein/bifunctional DNA primase/polymerase-like protein
MADPVVASPAGSIFDDHAPLYRAAGYRVVPIAPGTKYPGAHQGFGSYIALVGWPTSHVTDPQPGAGVGLICGDPLIAADIDSDDEALGVELIDALTDSNGIVITKAGKRGQTLLLRPPADGTVRSRKFLINGATVFEMLAEGRQTVLPPTIHPDLKKPYRWGNGATPLNTDLAQIALLRSDWEARVEAALAKYGYEPEPPKEEQRTFDETSPFQQINNLAMNNLPDWVPALNLYSCRRGRGFQNYEAIAVWRSSRNPLEERRANLKISSKGIVDFGTGKGYSPLDLVMASRACSLNEAFDWLSAHLAGRETNPTVVSLEAAKLQAEPEPERLKQDDRPRIRPEPFRIIDERTLPRRQWVLGGHYLMGTLTATVAPGGSGKSKLALVEGLSIALGRDLIHGERMRRGYRVWYHNAEDPRVEIERRILAICKYYKIDQNELTGWLHITSGLDMPIRVATGNGEIRIERGVVTELIEGIEEGEIEVASFDPLIAMHTTGESDNVKMRQVCDQFSKIANVTGAAVEIVHHVRKKYPGQEDHTTADARGAGSIIDAVRSARVINVMSRAEADRFGIEDLDRARHVRVDRGKANLAPSGLAFWLRPRHHDRGVFAISRHS